MISVGSGNGIFLEPNQLQADKQVNATRRKTLNRYSHATLRRHQRITQGRKRLVSRLDEQKLRAAPRLRYHGEFQRVYFSERCHEIGMEAVLSMGLPFSIAGSMRWPLTPFMQA
jgi:hypothetical protein